MIEMDLFELRDSSERSLMSLENISRVPDRVLPHLKENISGSMYMNKSQEIYLPDIMQYNNNLTTPSTLCDHSDIYNLGDRYKKVHGYIALLVCVFGVVANILNMIVLTRKEMRTPINLMLFALALADLLIMIEYIPFAIHMYVIEMPPEERYSLNAARFVFFHTHFTQILHTISIQLVNGMASSVVVACHAIPFQTLTMLRYMQLANDDSVVGLALGILIKQLLYPHNEFPITLSMAIWRYVAISCSNRSSSYCTFKRCGQVIAAAYICPLFLCILNYLYFQIDVKSKILTNLLPPLDDIDKKDEKKMEMFRTLCSYLKGHIGCEHREVNLYSVGVSQLATDNDFLHKMHFWTFSVFIKLIPCIVLTFFMCWLVNTLYKARRHHKMLEGKSGYPMSTVTNNHQEGQPLTPMKGKGASPEKSDGNGTVNSLKRKSSGRHIRIADDEQNNTPGIMGTTKNGSPPGCSIVATTATLGPPANGCSPTSSRRESNQSGDADIKDGSRRSKGFIRFPSIRRASHPDCKFSSGKTHKSCKRTDRTTKMLLAVLALFLLTEFPQGIMQLLAGWYGKTFFECDYNSWADIWDLLALINSAINFILYCFMSKQFRTQFRLLFKLHVCFHKPKWINIANCNHNATVSTTV